MERKELDDVPPSWTLFFEGTLYRRYLEYMRNHDLSRMLNNGSIVTNKNSPIQDPPVLTNETCWYPSDNKAYEKEAGYPDYNDPPAYPDGNNPQNGTLPPYNFSRMTSTSSGRYLTKPERTRRNRQTCGVVFLGFILLGIAATATALIIHFVFIEDREHVSDGGNVHIPSLNGTNSNITLQLMNQNKNITIVEDGKVISTGVKIGDVVNVLKNLERKKIKDAQSAFGKNTKKEEKKSPEFVLLPTEDNTTNTEKTTNLTIGVELPSSSNQTEIQKPENGKVLIRKPPTVNDNTPLQHHQQSTAANTVTSSPTDTTAPHITTMSTPKPEVHIDFNDTEFLIGTSGQLKCTISSLRIYDSVYISGSKIPINQDTILKYEVMSDGSSCLKGNDSRISVEFIRKSNEQFPQYEDIVLIVRFSNIQCNDADSFNCGVEGPDSIIQTAYMDALREADTKVRITYPSQMVENENAFLTARWMAGYPEEAGELVWTKLIPGSNTPQPLNMTINENSEPLTDCKTEITSFVNFMPTMEMNGTKINIQPILFGGGRVDAITFDVLVIPGDLCIGKSADTKISHPYTCEKYIKCSKHESVMVMKCPTKGTCFDEEAKQCVKMSR